MFFLLHTRPEQSWSPPTFIHSGHKVCLPWMKRWPFTPIFFKFKHRQNHNSNPHLCPPLKYQMTTFIFTRLSNFDRISRCFVKVSVNSWSINGVDTELCSLRNSCNGKSFMFSKIIFLISVSFLFMCQLLHSCIPFPGGFFCESSVSKL
jgi:hypothetical protein